MNISTIIIKVIIAIVIFITMNQAYLSFIKSKINIWEKNPELFKLPSSINPAHTSCECKIDKYKTNTIIFTILYGILLGFIMIYIGRGCPNIGQIFRSIDDVISMIIVCIICAYMEVTIVWDRLKNIHSQGYSNEYYISHCFIDKELYNSLTKIINYLYHDEEKDFYECGCEFPHIFTDIKYVSDALKGINNSIINKSKYIDELNNLENLISGIIDGISVEGNFDELEDVEFLTTESIERLRSFINNL